MCPALFAAKPIDRDELAFCSLLTHPDRVCVLLIRDGVRYAGVGRIEVMSRKETKGNGGIFHPGRPEMTINGARGDVGSMRIVVAMYADRQQIELSDDTMEDLRLEIHAVYILLDALPRRAAWSI